MARSIEGIASVDESAITGESAPVIRESGGDRSAVTGGTRVLSDWIKVRITAAQGSTFLDRMIALVEGAERQKTPNEIALNILLAGLTIIFVFAVATIPSFATYAGGTVSVVILVALFVALIPTTIGALLSAIGIAGMDRLVRFNVLAMSGRAVEAAGDVDTLLLDKTGTITLGNRQATEFIPLTGVTEQELADAAQLASLSDETPEGRSIVVLAKEKYGIRGREMAPMGARFIAFSAQTRLSGIDFDGSVIRKGAVDAVLAFVRLDSGNGQGGSGVAVATAIRPTVSDAAVRELTAKSDVIAKAGGTPLGVCEGWASARRDPSEGHREGRHFGALLRTAAHGHPHGDDHRRQPADRRGDRRRIGRGRLPGAGHAGNQAQADPRRAGAGQAGGDVRRRHQRRAGTGAGRCRRGDEHRHHGRARGRQHGRSRQRPDQADRDRRDRQAAPDDARRADHVLASPTTWRSISP